MDKIHVYRRSATKECKKGNAMDLLRKDIKDSDSCAMNGKDQDESAVTTEIGRASCRERVCLAV